MSSGRRIVRATGISSAWSVGLVMALALETQGGPTMRQLAAEMAWKTESRSERGLESSPQSRVRW